MPGPALFRFAPELEGRLPWVSLCPDKTEVQRLVHLQEKWNHPSLFIKREDQTDSVYGGNKVRNLEFVLAEAVNSKATKIVTMAPLGSNFVAALAAQTRRLKLKAEVHHFVMQRTPQILTHADFSEACGANLNVYAGMTGIARAASGGMVSMARSQFGSPAALWCAPGASNLKGALGHVNAALEVVEQVKNGEMPIPDVVVVGAGTCGTIAGLTAGFRLAGFPTQVIGVRCVDPIVCNTTTVVKLANRVLRYLGSSLRISPLHVRLDSSPLDSGYAKPILRAKELMDMFYETEGIHLDTTYTSKVVARLEEQVLKRTFDNKTVLYWHTFSPAAMLWNEEVSRSKLNENVVVHV